MAPAEGTPETRELWRMFRVYVNQLDRVTTPFRATEIYIRLEALAQRVPALAPVYRDLLFAHAEGHDRHGWFRDAAVSRLEEVLELAPADDDESL